MPPSDLATAAASRLCAACGMCCNGVMFHTVRLMPADSAKVLAGLGLKLKRKRGQNFILQPCPAFQESHCSIYAARPERCRLFECRQLQRVAAGEITEAMAREKIGAAARLVAEVNVLLERAGGNSPKRPLSRRFETARAEPLGPSGDEVAAETQKQLARAMQELGALLDQDFRIVPVGAASAPPVSE